MYGTIAKMRVKPACREALVRFIEAMPNLPDSYIGRVMYQMDDDPDVFYLAGVFDSKKGYFTHSDKPETHTLYLQLLELLENEPQWHDGEIVFTHWRE
jgi:quinol monooxygenase YgiN